MRHTFAVDSDARPFPRRVETTRSFLDADYDWLGSRPDARTVESRIKTRQHADRRFAERVEKAADEPEPRDENDDRPGLGFRVGVGIAGLLTAAALVQAVGIGFQSVAGLI